ncbi:MAG TPA: methyltransferase domain-containing protein [Phycisphaerae bacterium]|nr:methyltransferase domain-containing protein [Phycisphaerae bacterium]HRY70352.1 methyltransferase domain-containing protein [Phycisphaerae bacterium]HSA28069.1 methyltransferase domain-containing protein [Phycisphaerae bacterium]
MAAWYDRLVGDEGSDYHQKVILPVVLRLLDPRPAERFLDLCCGQGVLARILLERGAGSVLAVDASPGLIAAARRRGPADRRVRYEVRDARRLDDLADGSCDAAACVMAVQDLEGVDDLFRSMARSLKENGRAVIVMMHPCFRIPRQSSWGWDDEKKTQYRRIERYASPMTVPIATHPGREPDEHTMFHHRPLADYLNALGRAGLAVVACEEPLTHREPPPGPRAKGLKRAGEEIPVFLAFKAMRLPGCSPRSSEVMKRGG